MNEFIVPPVISDHSKVNEVLGEDWLKRQVDAALAATKGTQTLHPSRMSPTFGWIAHPLVSEAKQNAISEARTPIVDSLEIDLNDLASVSLLSNLSQRLRDDHDIHKAAYELRIAAGYHRLRHSIVWCPAIEYRHPEFFVLTSRQDILSVECKKRDASDGYEQEGARFWKHLQYTLRKKMGEESLNYWVKVSGREFQLADINTLVSEIISTIKVNEYGQFDSILGRYHIEYVWLIESGGSIPMELVNMFPRGNFGINVGQQNRGQIMVGPLTDPKLLRLEIADDPEHRIKGMIRNLKTAAKQVVQGLTNLVYLDVNIPNYELEQVEFDGIMEAIIEELSTRHRQVSAVILTNIYPALSLDEYLGWRVRTELILQPKPTVGLPKGLLFPGDTEGTHWLPGSISRHV